MRASGARSPGIASASSTPAQRLSAARSRVKGAKSATGPLGASTA